MKRRTLFPLVFLLLSIICVYAVAVGGQSSDPLISLSYLNSTYTDTVNQRINGLLSGAVPSSSVGSWTESRMKSADTLSGATGTNVMLLAGSATVSFSSGAVVDVTDGTELASGTPLTVRHRYIVAENTSAVFTISSKTAVVNCQGPYTFTPSSAVDYNAMAQSLKTLNLFRGSFTGYGSGFDLEVAPTRLQALIMFIRLLGEEDEALAYAGTTPFTDIEKGSEPERYVSYAYNKGYTNGYTATLFRPSQPVNAYQYTEFVLRALGYSTADNTDLSGTLSRAVSSNVLTSGEAAMLARDPFLRAELVYISYYALDAQRADAGGTLRQTLLAQGTFTETESLAAAGLVTSARLS